MIAGHAALLALKSGRPVKIIYDRVEDMIATTKRHPSIVRHRTGVMRDGRIVAMDIDVHARRRRVRHAQPRRAVARLHSRRRPVPLRQHAHPRPRDVHEHAAQRRVPRLRRAADGVRRRSAHGAHRRGARHGSGRAARDERAAARRHDRDRPDAARRHAARSRCSRRRCGARTSSASATQYKGTNKAIGLSLFYHGAGFTGSGELHLTSKARLELTPTGVRIAVGSTEIGQGTRTMHAQIVADALGIPYEDVEVAQPDTARVADSGPTVASRTCMVVGKILEECADRDEGAARTRSRRAEYLRAPRRVLRRAEVRAARLDPVGRRHLSRRRLRDVRLGLRRRRGRGRSATRTRCGRSS